MTKQPTTKLNNTLIKVVAMYSEIISDMDKTLLVIDGLTEDRNIIEALHGIRERNRINLEKAQDIIDLAKEELQTDYLMTQEPKEVH